jgi:antitoxin Phd
MNSTWQVQEAKSRLSELMERAVKDGPQLITRHGKPVVKVVAANADEHAASDGFLAFLLSIPRTGLDEGLPRMPRRNRRKPLFGSE